ncbi:MAG: sodium:calcium antiporter [Trueperaceae bacterium]
MPFDLSAWGLPALLAAFAGAALLISIAGVTVVTRADEIADRTGLGEAIVGALILGGATSLAGLVASVTAAWQGYPSLAISNAIGGIAVQTAFLAIADITYRRANLEHAAASTTNLSLSALLVTLLSMLLVTSFGPDLSFWGVHPASVVLVLAYVTGLRMVERARSEPMWFPKKTALTVPDKPSRDHDGRARSSAWIYGTFALAVAALGAAGYLVTQFGIAVADRSGLDDTAVGGLLIATVTSLPELVTTITAVRRKALTLAVGGIIGGNAFDTLFLAASDVAYRDGSLFHQFNRQDLFVVAVTILMTAVLLLGLLRRERSGVATIGFESALILVLYVAAVLVML